MNSQTCSIPSIAWPVRSKEAFETVDVPDTSHTNKNMVNPGVKVAFTGYRRQGPRIILHDHSLLYHLPSKSQCSVRDRPPGVQQDVSLDLHVRYQVVSWDCSLVKR